MMSREPFDPSRTPEPAEQRATSKAHPITVSQVTTLVKRAIERTLPATLHVVGEISNFKHHSSGHLYFTLKDKTSELSCVMWRSAATRLKFTPMDGLEVIATGSVEVFERAGRYQLYVRKLEPRGVGTLELAFRQLCERLTREGLFDKAHKKALPLYPRRIAIVTSPTGAAIADLLRTIEHRYPCVQVLLYPVAVQGQGAAQEIAAAIRRLNARATQLGGIDVMIVGRGGGSLEDLWAFNEEVVARAVYASRIPIVSAVGHEVDVSVCDLVADMRAATPTAAAELVVPRLEDVLSELEGIEHRLDRSLAGTIAVGQARLLGMMRQSLFRDPLRMIRRREQVVDEWTSRMQRVAADRLQARRRRLDILQAVVQRIAPHAYLHRCLVLLTKRQARFGGAVSRRIAMCHHAWMRSRLRLGRRRPLDRLTHLHDRLTRAQQRIRATQRHRLLLLREQVRRSENVLAALSYKSVLGRGFSITRLKRGGAVVRSLRQLDDGRRIVTEIEDGRFEADVVNLHQKELFD